MASLVSSTNVVVLLTENSLDRCMNDPHGEDVFRKEVAVAIRAKKNVVPVMTREFKFPEVRLVACTLEPFLFSSTRPSLHLVTDCCQRTFGKLPSTTPWNGGCENKNRRRGKKGRKGKKEKEREDMFLVVV